ncbi:MAG TPA: ribose-phosphate pyrophosphokinase [Thermoanaerobaculia bacterium]
MSEFVLLSGTAHPALSAAVSSELSIPLSACTVEKFPDGEITVHLNDSVRKREVFIIQPTSPPVNDHLMELLAFADACRRAAASRVVAVIPYFGYARSDKRGPHRDPIMASLVAAVLQAAGVDQVITIDPHSPQIEGCFHIPVDTWSAVGRLALALRGRIPPQTVIVAPDVGAVRLATHYGELLDRPVVVLHKRRATARETEVTHVVGEVRNRPAVIVDDMISTGGTIRRSIEALLSSGGRPDITVVATHSLMLEGSRAKLDLPSIREIIVSDTIPPCTDWPSLRAVSIAPLLADAIRHAASLKPAPIEEMATVVSIGRTV